MTRALFLCGRNRMRIPTAEPVFGSDPGLDMQSAGLDNDADVGCSPDLLRRAELVFVIEKTHLRRGRGT